MTTASFSALFSAKSLNTGLNHECAGIQPFPVSIWSNSKSFAFLHGLPISSCFGLAVTVAVVPAPQSPVSFSDISILESSIYDRIMRIGKEQILPQSSTHGTPRSWATFEIKAKGKGKTSQVRGAISTLSCILSFDIRTKPGTRLSSIMSQCSSRFPKSGSHYH